MRKIILGILIGVIVLSFSGIATAAIMIPGADKAKEKAGLERIEFIHYKKGYTKPTAAKTPKPPACYKFLTPTKVKWTDLPVDYVINPTNPQSLSESFITSAVYNSAETWDAATSKELMNNAYTIDYNETYGTHDYKNAIVFSDYPTAGVIAVTTVWYNPATKSIVEFDIMFDTDWTWGDATASSTVMDLQNIATHELGHGVGLADVYDTVCSTVTMYGHSDYGEIQKKTLETPDITGLQTLYGI